MAMKKILLNSLPKAGSHLLIKLMEMLGYEFARANFSSSTIYGRHVIPKYFLRGVLFGQSGVEVGLDIAACARASWVIKALDRIPDGCFAGGHLPYSDSMLALANSRGVRAIHILRDPRDVLLSWAHYVPKTDWHYGRAGLEGQSLEERVRKILHGYQSGRFRIESFKNILNRSNGWVGQDEVLTVRFEDLVGPKGGGNIEVQIDTITRIAEFTDAGEINMDNLSGALFGGTKVFRKGAIGSWKDEFSSSLVKEVHDSLGDVIVRMGYVV
jgi:hypothetical protein